jgi:hypothetical protein
MGVPWSPVVVVVVASGGSNKLRDDDGADTTATDSEIVVMAVMLLLGAVGDRFLDGRRRLWPLLLLLLRLLPPLEDRGIVLDLVVGCEHRYSTLRQYRWMKEGYVSRHSLELIHRSNSGSGGTVPI